MGANKNNPDIYLIIARTSSLHDGERNSKLNYLESVYILSLLLQTQKISFANREEIIFIIFSFVILAFITTILLQQDVVAISIVWQ